MSYIAKKSEVKKVRAPAKAAKGPLNVVDRALAVAAKPAVAAIIAAVLCALCGESATGTLPERHQWSRVRGQSRVMYIRKDGQWLATKARVCAACFDAAIKRPTPGYCYTCNDLPRGAKGKGNPRLADAAKHQKEHPGHYVRRGRL